MTKGVKIAKITENDSQEQRISKLNSNFQNLLAASMRLDKLGILCNRNKKQTDEVAADAVAAQTAADSAQQSAKDAQTAANNAQIMADAAQSSANEAAAAASNAQTTADNAAKNAQEANEKAQSAATDAAKANIDLSEVKAEVTNIKADSVTLRSDLEGQIETFTTTMETDYAKKTDLSDTEATLRTEISTSAAGITQIVSETYAKKTDVTDAITTAKADLQTQITQNAESISLTSKSVEQAQVDIKENATNITEAKSAAATAQSTANAAKTDAAEAATAAANAQSAADVANTAASNAQTKANEAATAAATAKTAADKAKTDLATAQAKLAEVEANANATAEDLATAQQAVETAQAAADAAQDAANTAQANAATAKSTADTAKANAEAAQTTANTAKTNAENAKKAAEDAQASAKAANDALAVLEPRVTAAETAIEQNAEEITLRATKTEVTALENRVTTAESKITSDAIVNTVKGSSQFQAAGDYVTGTEAYSQLKQTVSSINGEVFNSDGSSKLEQTASSLTSQINGKQDKGDYVTGTAEYSQLKQTVSGINSTVQSHSGSISNLQQTAEGIQIRLDNQQTVRNLVSKSRLLDGWGYVVSAGVTVSKNVSTSAPELGEVTVARFNASTANSSDQSSYIHMTNAARVTSGSKYTLSVWARKVSGGNARPRLSLSTTNQSAIITENLTTEWKRYSYTFALGAISGSSKYVDITTSFGVSVLAGQTGVFEICCPQLEAGDTMNPWSASSTDSTDFMAFSTEGLVIGDMTGGTLQGNVKVDSDSVDIRMAEDTVARFGSYPEGWLYDNEMPYSELTCILRNLLVQSEGELAILHSYPNSSRNNLNSHVWLGDASIALHTEDSSLSSDYATEIVLEGNGVNKVTIRAEDGNKGYGTIDMIGNVVINPNGSSFKPYYASGTTAVTRLFTAGYVTSSKTQVVFTVPIERYCTYRTVSITSASGGAFKLRQDGAYTHGSGSSTLVNPSSYTATHRGKYITVVATFSNTTNAVNNAPVGIEFSGNLTFG